MSVPHPRGPAPPGEGAGPDPHRAPAATEDAGTASPQINHRQGADRPHGSAHPGKIGAARAKPDAPAAAPAPDLDVDHLVQVHEWVEPYLAQGAVAEPFTRRWFELEADEQWRSLVLGAFWLWAYEHDLAAPPRAHMVEASHDVAALQYEPKAWRREMDAYDQRQCDDGKPRSWRRGRVA